MLDDVAYRVIEERRAKGIEPEANDILSHMLRAQAAGDARASDRQLRDELQTFVFAGSDTTATTLSFALLELSRRPDIAARCAEEVDRVMGDRPAESIPAEDYQRMPLLTGVASETLRMYPAAVSISRRAAQDTVLGGYFLPAGTRVGASVYGLQRHEDFWPQPDAWIPERWLPVNSAIMAPHADRAYMPFTAGPRACIGKFFALVELQVLLAVILRRTHFAAAPRNEAARAWQNLTLTCSDGARVIPTPRSRR